MEGIIRPYYRHPCPKGLLLERQEEAAHLLCWPWTEGDANAKGVSSQAQVEESDFSLNPYPHDDPSMLTVGSAMWHWDMKGWVGLLEIHSYHK